MAKKLRRLLALTMALALCAGQIMVPTFAMEEEEQTIAVSVELEGYSRIPEGSDTLEVTQGESSTTEEHDPAKGEIVTTTTTTTTWTGVDENGNYVEGSETHTQFTGNDDMDGFTLYEGGSLEGEETTTTTQTSTETTTEELVTEEVTTEVESTTKTEESTQTHNQDSSSTQEGSWNTSGEVTEGSFEAEHTDNWTQSETVVLGDGQIPDEGITIQMTPDENGFSGQATGEVILLTEAMEIPEGAQLVYDKDNNLIGYRLYTEQSQITGTTENHGEAAKTENQTDENGVTAPVTPDLEAAADNLNIPITEESVITEEKNDQDQVFAYVVTNTREETGTLAAHEAMEKPESGTVTLENGNTQTVTTEDILDENGNVTGFISRTVITDASGKVIQDTTTTQTVVRNAPPQAAEPVITYTLPEKPAESTVTAENGNVTTVTVAEILDENNQVIGYEELTIETDADGNELFRNSRQLLGTTTTVTQGVEVSDPSVSGTYSYTRTTVDTYRVTAEQTAYQDIETYTRLTSIVNDMTVEKQWEIVEIDGKLYYIYLGSMAVTEGAGHGDTSMMNPVTPMDSLMNENSKLDLDAGDTGSSKNPEDGFKYIGYGVNSSISINKSGGSTTNVTQFKLKAANGKEYFAHCIDFSTSIVSGHLYDIRDIENENYYQQTGTNKSAAEIIRQVALNGYWGTESGVGSLGDVQAFLEDYLTGTMKMSQKEARKIVDSLTPGQAQAATQAALWKYGNKNNTSLNANNTFTGDDTDESNAKYLYNALLAAATNPNAETEDDEGVEFLDAEDVTGGAITINNKVAPSEDNGYAENVYNTDLSFTLGIEPAKLNGDLIVTVTVGGEEVKKVRLAGADDPLLPMGRIVKNADGSYTIPGIQITEGVSVNLNLSGTQDLGTGVYIFTSMTGDYEKSQTLVTLASGERQVNLNMNMKLTVEDPTATVTQTGQVQTGTRTDTRVDTRTDVITRTETATTSGYVQTSYESGSGTRTETVEVVVTELTVKKSVEKNHWAASWLNTYERPVTPYNGDVGFVDSGAELVIPDEAVPLANAPKTGDITAVWAAVSLISLAGMVLLAKKRETV